MMLARKVVTRSGRGTRGYFPSVKMGRMIEWESLLERDAILLMEFSPGVVAYREQPERIQYYDHITLSLREYFPDFEITLSGNSYIHFEVKPEVKLATRKVADKLRNVAAHYCRCDREFRVLTDKVIRRQPLLTNLNRLFYLKRPKVDLAPAHQKFGKILAGQASLPFEYVEAKIGGDDLLRLVAFGLVVCDLNLPLAGNNSVRFAEEADHAALLF
jgi:hypothetical protein